MKKHCENCKHYREHTLNLECKRNGYSIKDCWEEKK